MELDGPGASDRDGRCRGTWLCSAVLAAVMMLAAILAEGNKEGTKRKGPKRSHPAGQQVEFKSLAAPRKAASTSDADPWSSYGAASRGTRKITGADEHQCKAVRDHTLCEGKA